MPESHNPAAPFLRDVSGRRGTLLVLLLAALFWGAARIPHATGLVFQAYFFWPAAAVSHTAYFTLGRRAGWGIALGSLFLNGTGWLPWPHALMMVGLQTVGPLVAWRALIALGTPQPDLRRIGDLLRWLGVTALASAVFSSGLGSLVVGLATPGGAFPHALATAVSWFLGDLTALLCLGPIILHFFSTGPAEPPASLPELRSAPSWVEKGLAATLCLLLLFAGRVDASLSGDFRLALAFALVLPLLWVALRFGPKDTSICIALLSLAFLIQLGASGPKLTNEALRFSQLHLLVLALAALVTASATEESRLAHLALHVRDLQAQRMEAIGTLAGGLVHGFNNQLTVVLGNLDRLKGFLPDGTQASHVVARLEEAALSMGSTVQQLKALSHQAPLQATPLSLNEALAPFILKTKELPDHIAFRLDVGEDPIVGLDPDLLNQTLHHLLTNAVEAISEAGCITLCARCGTDGVHLVLEDTGVGMSQDVLVKACDPFFTTKPMATGQGLGLSIAFALTKQMGGRLSLASQPAKGTRVELILPLGQTVPASAPVPLRFSRNRQILLADDEPGIREVTREFLECEGFQVFEASDGQEAWSAFRSDPEAWDLVILDWIMPRLGGAEVLHQIEQVRPDLPCLMMSGYSAEARPDLLKAPNRRFLAKPFRLQELVDALKALGLQSQASTPSGSHEQ